MNLPGFTAQDSLYRSNFHYVTTHASAPGSSVVPQLQVGGLTDSQLYFCRLACAYCYYYGYYCWTCYICAWIVVLGGARAE
jgi:hypothetical protein